MFSANLLQKMANQLYVYSNRRLLGTVADLTKEVEARLSAQYYSENRSVIKEHDTSQPVFSMCFPPPNVTGCLHLGHALTVSIQDVICRWNRMKGRNVVWIPGFDHAGIATQSVVERNLLREHGISRHELGRDAFIKHCMLWKDERAKEMTEQLKQLGASFDIDKMYYTMDTKFSSAVSEAFVRFHKQGLISRQSRLVNHCPYLKSTISDAEVNVVQVNGPTSIKVPGCEAPVEIGYLYDIYYPLLDGSDGLAISTTRPETLFADVAVAVHPGDDRYSSLIGKQLQNPFTSSRIPVIADESIKQDVGTGAVKITPAHSFTDYAIGVRHNLPLNVTCLDEDGNIVLNNASYSSDMKFIAPELFNGLNRFDARRKVIEILVQSGLLKKVSEHSSTIPVCSRSGDILEPLPKEQWFLDCPLMAELAADAVQSGILQIKPTRYIKEWLTWHSGSKNRLWCLSRQLWWGHQIPAYSFRLADGSTKWVVGANKEAAFADAVKIAQEKCFNPPSIEDLQQDEDVVDTWFSSSLVPLVVSGWPNSSSLPFYPFSLMETGSDIMGFWVSRMVMLCTQLMLPSVPTPSEAVPLPFKQIVFHGMVRDLQGRKMSKSLGNVIDPRDIIYGTSVAALVDRVSSSNLADSEIKRALSGLARAFPKGVVPCGADALRTALLSKPVTDVNILFNPSNAEDFRKFTNKLWQAFHYCCLVWQESSVVPLAITSATVNDYKPWSLPERWILSRLSLTVGAVNLSLQELKFDDAIYQIRTFFWNEFCDIYLEHTKPALWSQNIKRLEVVSAVLSIVFDSSLKLLAPFMPFITEELFGHLQSVNNGAVKSSVHIQRFPDTELFSTLRHPAAENEMSLVLQLIKEVRSLRKALDIKNNTALSGIIVPANEADVELSINETRDLLFRLIGIQVEVKEPGTVFTSTGISTIIGTAQLHIPLENVDKASVTSLLEKKVLKNQATLEENQTALQKELKRLQQRRTQALSEDGSLEEEQQIRLNYAPVIETCVNEIDKLKLFISNVNNW